MGKTTCGKVWLSLTDESISLCLQNCPRTCLKSVGTVKREGGRHNIVDSAVTKKIDAHNVFINQTLVFHRQRLSSQADSKGNFEGDKSNVVARGSKRSKHHHIAFNNLSIMLASSAARSPMLQSLNQIIFNLLILFRIHH